MFYINNIRENLSRIFLTEWLSGKKIIISTINIKLFRSIRHKIKLKLKLFGKNISKISEIFPMTNSLEIMSFSISNPNTEIGFLNLLSLTELNIGKCYISNIQIKYILNNCPTLTSLDLNNCYDITDVVIKNIIILKLLKSINIKNCNKITNKGVSYFSKCLLLETINVNGCYLINDLSFISNLKSLMSLNIGYCHRISDKTIECIPESLTELKIEYCDITDETIRLISKLQFLKVLDLSGNEYITNVGMKYLQNLKLLEIIDVRFCKIKNKDIKFYLNLKNLKFINGCNKITII